MHMGFLCNQFFRPTFTGEGLFTMCVIQAQRRTGGLLTSSKAQGHNEDPKHDLPRRITMLSIRLSLAICSGSSNSVPFYCHLLSGSIIKSKISHPSCTVCSWAKRCIVLVHVDLRLQLRRHVTMTISLWEQLIIRTRWGVHHLYHQILATDWQHCLLTAQDVGFMTLGDC